MKTGERETIAEHLKKSGVSRRSFLQLCSTLIVAAPIGLSLTSKATAAQVARIVGKARIRRRSLLASTATGTFSGD